MKNKTKDYSGVAQDVKFNTQFRYSILEIIMTMNIMLL